MASAMFSSLSIPNYRRFAAGGVVTNVGTWMQRIAQDWLVLQIAVGSSATALGVTTALQFLPALVIGPFVGVLIDRVDKRRMLQWANVAMAVPALILGLLAVTGQAEVWHVWALALALGVAAAFDAPTRQAFVSELVGPEHLTNAVSLNSASFNGARLVGPAVAGLLIALFGGDGVATGWVILLNALTYAAPVIALATMDPAQLHRSAPSKARGLAALREGLGYVRRRPEIVTVMAIVLVVGMFTVNFSLGFALMATEVFGVGATEYGLLSTFLAVGSLTGALLSARRSQASMKVVLLAAGAVGMLASVAAWMPTYASLAILAPLLGLAALTLMTNANAYVQLRCEPEVRGRVMALYMVVLMGGAPIGSPLLGWVGETFGARWVLGVGGAATLVGVTLAAAYYQTVVRSRNPILTLANPGE